MSAITTNPVAVAPAELAAERGGRGRIALNFFSLTTAAVSERIIWLFSSIYTRRVLGAAAIGQYNWSAAVLTYFTLLINPGLETIAKREAANDPRQTTHYVSVLFSLQIVLAALAFGLVALFACLKLRGPEISLLLLLQAITLLLAPLNLGWVLHSRDRMTALAAFNVLLVFLQLPATFLLIHNPSHLTRFVLLPYPFRLALLIFTAWYAHRLGLIDWRGLQWSLRKAVPLLKEALPLGLSQAAILIYYNFDTIFLGFSGGDRVVGLYSTAYKLMLIPMFMFQAVHSAFFPALSRSKDDPQEAMKISSTYLRLLAWIGFPVAALSWAVGRHVITLLYGSGFAEIGPVYECLCLNLALIYLNCGIMLPFINWGRQAVNFRITIVGAVVNVALNILMIPRFGVWGAVMTTILAEVAVLILGSRARRRIHPIAWPRMIIAPLACSVVAAALVRAVTWQWPWAWLVALLVGTTLVAAWCWKNEPEAMAALLARARSHRATP